MRFRPTRNAEPWPWKGPRIVVEHPDEEAGRRMVAALRDEGYAVALCGGPDDLAGCPLAGPGDCSIAHDADAVVSCLGPDASPAVLAALRARCPDVPLIVDPVDVVAAVQEALHA